MILLVELWQFRSRIRNSITRYEISQLHEIFRKRDERNKQRDAIDPLPSLFEDGNTNEQNFYTYEGGTKETLVRASRIYFHFSRISPPFYRISEFCFSDVRRPSARCQLEIWEDSWQMNEIPDLIWFFVIHLRGWKYSCIHDGCRVNPSNPFDRFLGLSTPWMQIRFRRGIIWSLSEMILYF